MQNFEKPLSEFTEDELQQKVNQWSPQFSALALHELQRRQQKENTEQISTVVKEIIILKEIADISFKTSEKNARSANKIAIAAFAVGILSLVIEAFQTETAYNFQCFYTGSAVEKNQTERCEVILRIGTHNFYWEGKQHDVKY